MTFVEKIKDMNCFCCICRDLKERILDADSSEEAINIAYYYRGVLCAGVEYIRDLARKTKRIDKPFDDSELDELDKWIESKEVYHNILDEIREAHHPATVALYFSLIEEAWQASKLHSQLEERKRIVEILKSKRNHALFDEKTINFFIDYIEGRGGNDRYKSNS